jgi:hypothetical protein
VAEPRKVLTASWPVDLTGLRAAGAAMIGLGVGLQLLPHNPGVPCPMRTITGVPCPACGMTTAVKAAVRGHMGASLAANPFGVVAIACAVLLLLRPHWHTIRLPISIVIAAGLTSWIWELRRFGFL